MQEVEAQFDFAAQPDSNELNLVAGETLRIVRQDVGDGWWEGVNQRGERGLFPISYVKILAENGNSQPPTAPPPPLPNLAVLSHSTGHGAELTSNRVSRDSWGDEHSSAVGPAKVKEAHTTGGTTMPGDFEDDWSDDESQTAGSYDFRDSAARSNVVIERNTNVDDTASTMKKNMNLFSPFVKSGVEGYLLNNVKLSSKPTDVIEILEKNRHFDWAPKETYTCQIGSRQKASKLHGLKSFIAYQLTPSLTNIQVSRRYKHFDWLIQRLQEKYTFVFVPPLPEKQMTGRYESEFVEHRMNLLQMWLNKVCRHPVLSKSEVWVHFLTCTDEREWKKGKRRAEKDEYSGGLLFYAIKYPMNLMLDHNEVERQVEVFGKKCRHAEESVRNFQTVANDNVKRMVGPFKREFLRIGSAFRSLASTFPGAGPEQALSSAIVDVSSCYENIGQAYEEQPRLDWLPLLDELFMHRGTLNYIPEVLQGHKTACSKLRETQRMLDEGKISSHDYEGVKNRLNVVDMATLAELSHFEKERLADYQRIMRQFLDAQIKFYEGFVQKLRDAASSFDKCQKQEMP